METKHLELLTSKYAFRLDVAIVIESPMDSVDALLDRVNQTSGNQLTVKKMWKTDFPTEVSELLIVITSSSSDPFDITFMNARLGLPFDAHVTVVENAGGLWKPWWHVLQHTICIACC